MAKINLDNIAFQLSKVEAESEDMVVYSKPMSLQVNQIIVNPNNIASINDTDESIKNLADSITASGLIHPLTVNKIDDNRYMLLSGERRYKAITTYLNWETIPCTVYDNIDSNMTTLVTVQANMETREYTVSDRLALYKQLDTALNNLKSEGKFKGGVGRAIGKMLGVSEQQIGKYKKIINTFSEDEIKEVTNINKSIADIKEKTETEVKFFNENQAKTETEVKFFDELKKIVKRLNNLLEIENSDQLSYAVELIEEIIHNENII